MLCKSAVTLFTNSTHFAEPVWRLWVNKLLEFKGSKNIFTFARGLLMMALLSVWTESLLPPTLWYLHTSPQVGCAKCVCVELQSQCVFSRSSTGSSQKPENGSWGANSKHNSDTLTLPPYYYTRHSNTPNTPPPFLIHKMSTSHFRRTLSTNTRVPPFTLYAPPCSVHLWPLCFFKCKSGVFSKNASEGYGVEVEDSHG